MAFCNNTAGLESSVDLVVKLLTIRHENESPVTGDFTEDFLSEENHRDTLSTPLSMPEHAELAFTVPLYMLIRVTRFAEVPQSYC